MGGRLAARECFDQSRPVGLTIGLEIDRNSGVFQSDISDLDAPDQQREKAQARRQTLRAQGRLFGIAKHDVSKVDAACGK